MKVYDLCCEHDHRFEGWFASEDEFIAQSEQAMIACPLCGSLAIRKLLSAPRLNLSGGQQQTQQQREQRGGEILESHAQLLAMMREVIANTDDVGAGFAEEARRIYYKEVPERSIRGVATRQESDALADEGIEVLRFAALETGNDTLH